MKIFFFLFILFIVSSAQSQWNSIGNCDRLDTNSRRIKNFAITDDNKYFFTLDSSNVIKKFDYNTGDTIWTKKILPDSTLSRADEWLFLSSDGKTYNKIYFPIAYSYFKQLIEIFDIETDLMLDSVSYSGANYEPQYESVTFKMNLCDYTFSSQILFTSFAYYGSWSWAYNGSETSGLTKIVKKTDTGWIKKFSYQQSLMNQTFNKTKDLFYLFFYYSINNSMQHPNPYYLTKIIYSNNYYSILLDSVFSLSYYEYKGSANGQNPVTYTQTGTLYNFLSAFFTNDNQNLILTQNDSILKFNLLTNKFIQIQKINKYYNQKLYAVNSSDSNLFFILKNNIINIHGINDFRFYCSFVPDSLNSIVLLKNSIDNQYIFLTDTKGSLFRVNSSDIFRLKANFTTSDSVFMVGDTVSFVDGSLGYPDNYYWDFGDGKTSVLSNPYHIYSDSGYYDVKLIVSKGNLKDSIIKNRFLYISPMAIPLFDYTINSGFPVTLNFKNKSVGNIDSLKWSFGDSTVSIEPNPTHNYSVSGDYKVSLKIFSKRFNFIVNKVISIKVTEPKLDNKKYFNELTDTIHTNSIAIKGWEDNNNYLVYHLLQNDKVYYHGAYYNKVIKWEIINNWKEFLVKKANGTYCNLSMDSIYNFNKYGTESSFNNYKKAYDVLNVRSSNNNIIASSVDSYHNNYYYLAIFDENNNFLQNNTVRVLNLDDFKVLELKTWNILGLCNGIKYDFAISFYYAEQKIYNNYQFQSSVFNINKDENLSFIKFNDFIRLNDSTLVFINDSRLRIIKNYGLRFDSVKVPQVNQITKDTNYVNFNFNSLLKINDTSFIAAGSYNNTPAYVFFNKNAEIIDSASISSRFGEFRYVSLTPDFNLLLSGYRYKYFQNKSPYFVKSNDSIVGKMFPGYGQPIDSIPNDSIPIKLVLSGITCSPNPTNNISTISFNLNEEIQLGMKLYDSFGGLVFDAGYQKYVIGLNEIKINFAPFASGMYFYRFYAGNQFFTGKIIFYR